MSSFPARPFEIWRSSVAEEMDPIHGVFEFIVAGTLMVDQTLQYLREWRLAGVVPGRIAPFVRAMANYQPDGNRIWYQASFPDATALFNTSWKDLYALVSELELHFDINLSILQIQFLADVGTGPSVPLFVAKRRSLSRGVGFEIQERGRVADTIMAGDLAVSAKAALAQQHYSTAIGLLAAEDQLPGLVDAAFMQFYLAIETLLEAHEDKKAVRNGIAFYGAEFTPALERIVTHCYIARHRFFGHAHVRWTKGQSDHEVAFQIAKQTLVARWCARALMSLELGCELVSREMRFGSGVGGSVQFAGDPIDLDAAFALPT